jgi:DNA-directed RNA polymerase specialized sigma24 family protein
VSGWTSEEQQGVLRSAYRAHFSALLRVARLLCPTEEGATERVLEAFARLAVRPNGLSSDDLTDELLRAVLAACRKTGRRTGRRANSAYAAWQSHAPSLEPRDRAVCALYELSDRQRECVVLRHYLGFGEARIASLLQCSTSSVRTHHRRGMERLTGLIGAVGEVTA